MELLQSLIEISESIKILKKLKGKKNHIIDHHFDTKGNRMLRKS